MRYQPVMAGWLGLAAFSTLLWANRDGAQPRKTGGSFPAESVCTECHSGPFGSRPNAGPGSITFSVQPYRPGETQRITITVADPGALQIRWGFSMTARPKNTPASQAGNFRAVDVNSQVICDNDLPAPCPTPAMLQFPSHTRAGTRRGMRTPVSFDIEWTAPSSNVGTIVFAAAGNAANGNDLESGDNVYTRSVEIEPAAAGGPTPRISQNGVIGAGLSNPAVRNISANGIISIFGENFAPAGTARGVSSADLVDGKLPTALAGACVQVGGQFARMFFVSPGQINVQVPTLAGAGTMAVKVLTNCTGTTGAESNSESVTLAAVAPEFFFFQLNANGSNPIAALNAVTFARIGAPGLIAGVEFTPAKPDDILSLYSSGLGRTNPAFEAGVLPPVIASTVSPVRVTIGGMNAEVLYAGVAPGLAGLYQINVRVPNVPDGNQAVVATIDSVSTPAGAFITVRR